MAQDWPATYKEAIAKGYGPLIEPHMSNNYWGSSFAQIVAQVPAAQRDAATEYAYQQVKNNDETGWSNQNGNEQLDAMLRATGAGGLDAGRLAAAAQEVTNQQASKVDNSGLFSKENLFAPMLFSGLAGGAGALSGYLGSGAAAGAPATAAAGSTGGSMNLSDLLKWFSSDAGATDAPWGVYSGATDYAGAPYADMGSVGGGSPIVSGGYGADPSQLYTNSLPPSGMDLSNSYGATGGAGSTGNAAWDFNLGGAPVGAGAPFASFPGEGGGSDMLSKIFGNAVGGAANTAGSMLAKNALGGAGGAAAGTPLSRILANDGTATAADWASIAGTAGSTGLGLLGAREQAKTLKELAEKQMAAEQGRYVEQRDINQTRYAEAQRLAAEATARGVEAQAFGRSVGAPSRGRYEGSFAPGFSMESDPGYTDALNQSAKATLHGLSTGGNPAGSPNAWAASLSDLYGKTAYPALQQYRSNNAATGGFGSFAEVGARAPGYTAAGTGNSAGFGNPNAGAQTDVAAAGAGGNMFNVLGSGLANLTNPAPTLADLLKQMRGFVGTGVFGTT